MRGRASSDVDWEYFNCSGFVLHKRIAEGLLVRLPLGVESAAYLPREVLRDSENNFLTVGGVESIGCSSQSTALPDLSRIDLQCSIFRRSLAADETCRIWEISFLDGSLLFFLGRIRHCSESAGWGPWQLTHLGGHSCGRDGSHIVWPLSVCLVELHILHRGALIQAHSLYQPKHLPHWGILVFFGSNFVTTWTPNRGIFFESKVLSG